jgi:hypothetical protein
MDMPVAASGLDVAVAVAAVAVTAVAVAVTGCGVGGRTAGVGVYVGVGVAFAKYSIRSSGKEHLDFSRETDISRVRNVETGRKQKTADIMIG